MSKEEKNGLREDKVERNVARKYYRIQVAIYLYFQSNLLLCKYNDKIGTSDTSVSCPPASRSSTFQFGISLNRFARTDPAAPPPTIIKS